MKTSAGFIIILTVLFSCSGGTKQEKDLMTDNFFKKLKIGEKNSGIRIDLEEDQFWDTFLSLGNKSIEVPDSLLPPDIQPILDFPLIFKGDTIREERIEVNKKTIGEAFCINGKPTIRYFTKLKYIDSYGLAFFRMHEFAHFLLGHMDCYRNVIPKPEIEFAADKKAIELLEQFKDGVRIVDHARGIMLGMNTRRTSTHPGSVERAKTFYQ